MSTTPRPSFASDDHRRRFEAAYDDVLALWPAHRTVDLPSEFGRTHVTIAGDDQAPPLLLLHGGGATGTVWFADAPRLAERFRVLAVDQIGDAGRSVHDGRPLRSAADFTAWLGTVLDDLGVRAATVVGHSYGAWHALNLALDAPTRVSRLVLLDPTGCLSGMRFTYRARAVPLFARPGASSMERFLRWETGGAPLNADWFRLTCLAAEAKGSPLVLPRRPARTRMRALPMPITVLLAEQSRQLSTARAARVAGDLWPSATVDVVPGATHHTLPTLHAQHIDAVILATASGLATA